MNAVLVVEDEALVAMDLVRQVRSLGYEVVGPCRNVEDALERISGGSIKAALLDFALRNETSEPVAARLAEQGIAFAFLTGYAAGGAIARTSFADRPRMSKPCATDELARVLEQLTG